MRVLVTGSSGRVGRVAVNHLAQAGHEVVAFDLDLGLDLRSDGDVRRAVEGAEAIVHLAAVLGRRDEGDEDFIQVNLVGTWRLLNEAVRAGVGRFVFTSLVTGQDKPETRSKPRCRASDSAWLLCGSIRGMTLSAQTIQRPGE